MNVCTFLKFFLGAVLHVSYHPHLASPSSHKLYHHNSRNIVVDRDQRTVRTSHLPSSIPQTLESLGRGDFVHEVSVNVEQGVALARLDDVVVKDLVVEGSGLGGRCGHLGRELKVWGGRGMSGWRLLVL